MTTPLPDIFEYDDYRRFLNDWVAVKRDERSFSLRAFARRAGFRAHNMLQLVMNGRRNLSADSVRKFAAGLGLGDEEGEYFENLVLMNQSRSARDRLRYYERLVGHPRRRKVRPLERDQLAMFSHWAGPVVYEMISFPDFRPDPDWISEQFDPQLSPQEASRILRALLSAGLVEVDGDGKWRVCDEQINTGDNVHDMHLFAYHEHALAKASDALHEVVDKKRNFHVLTAAVPKSLIAELIRLSAKFESEVWSAIERSEDAKDEVIQISLQIFPSLNRRAPGDRGGRR